MKDTGHYLIGISVHPQEMAFLSITSMYLYKFIIPSIRMSEGTTEKLETAPEHLFGFHC